MKTLAKNTLLMGCLLALGAWGCAVPKRSFDDASAAIESARENCAAEYATADYNKAKSLLDEANAEETKRRTAVERADEALATAQAAEQAAVARKDSARKEAESAIAGAEEALEQAREAGAEEYAASQYNQAVSKLDAAKAEMQKGDCNYLKAKKLADEAASLANAAADAARKARAEEERQKAEEAARLEALKNATLNEWTVERGDTLWEIATHENVYADPFLWPLIFKANRSKIKEPDLIFPKQVFTLTQDASEGEKKSAVRHARNRRWPDIEEGYDDRYVDR
jgi:nucleoid-associated protein YgaU